MSRPLGFALLAAALSFCWWEGGLHQDQLAAHVSVVVVIALVLGIALVAGVGRQAVTARQWMGGPLAMRDDLQADRPATVAVLIWIGLLAAVVGWDLNSFVHQSHGLPTLSSILGHLTSTRPGRAGTVAAWLALGATLAVGWRRR